jgi:hypothetical protein
VGEMPAPRKVNLERRELVSPRTRRAFREYLVGWPLGAIQDLFENEGLQLGQGSPAVTGQRRSLVERYYTTVDWTSPQEVRRVLRAYEHVLADADLPPPIYGELKRHLEWDGYAMDATGRLRSPPAGSLAELPVTSLDDPAAIYEHIDRIGRVMDTDLAQAISGAWRWRSSSAGRWFTASEGRRATSLARRAAPQPRR